MGCDARKGRDCGWGVGKGARWGVERGEREIRQIGNTEGGARFLWTGLDERGPHNARDTQMERGGD